MVISRGKFFYLFFGYTHIHCRCVTFVLENTFIQFYWYIQFYQQLSSSTVFHFFDCFLYSIHGYRQILNCCGNISAEEKNFSNHEIVLTKCYGCASVELLCSSCSSYLPASIGSDITYVLSSCWVFHSQNSLR